MNNSKEKAITACWRSLLSVSKKCFFDTLFRLIKSSEGKALTPVGVQRYGKVCATKQVKSLAEQAVS